MLTAITASAQSTARKFVLKNSSDGLSELTSYLPKKNRNIPLSDAYQAMRTVRDSSAVWRINKEDDYAWINLKHNDYIKCKPR